MTNYISAISHINNEIINRKISVKDAVNLLLPIHAKFNKGVKKYKLPVNVTTHIVSMSSLKNGIAKLQKNENDLKNNMKAFKSSHPDTDLSKSQTYQFWAQIISLSDLVVAQFSKLIRYTHKMNTDVITAYHTNGSVETRLVSYKDVSSACHLMIKKLGVKAQH